MLDFTWKNWVLFIFLILNLVFFLFWMFEDGLVV